MALYKCNCFKIREGLILTVYQRLPNVYPPTVQLMYSRCLPNICPMSAECSRCRPNVVCGQILDFFRNVLFILELFKKRGLVAESWFVVASLPFVKMILPKIPFCQPYNEDTQLYFCEDSWMTSKIWQKKILTTVAHQPQSRFQSALWEQESRTL